MGTKRIPKPSPPPFFRRGGRRRHRGRGGDGLGGGRASAPLVSGGEGVVQRRELRTEGLQGGVRPKGRQSLGSGAGRGVVR